MSSGDKSRRTYTASSNNTAAFVRFLDFWVVSWSQQNERNFMMNNTDGAMGGWSGGGMWIWAVIGVAVVVLLAVVIGKMSKK